MGARLFSKPSKYFLPHEVIVGFVLIVLPTPVGVL